MSDYMPYERTRETEISLLKALRSIRNARNMMIYLMSYQMAGCSVCQSCIPVVHTSTVKLLAPTALTKVEA